MGVAASPLLARAATAARDFTIAHLCKRGVGFIPSQADMQAFANAPDKVVA